MLHPLQYLVEPLPCLLNRSIWKKTPVLSMLSLFLWVSKHIRFGCLAKKFFVKVVVRKHIFKKYVSLLLQSLIKPLSAGGPQLTSSTATETRGLKSALIKVLINGKKFRPKISGRSHPQQVWSTWLRLHCVRKLKVTDREFKNVKLSLSLLPHLCADVILGHDFLNQHSEVFISLLREMDQTPFLIL